MKCTMMGTIGAGLGLALAWMVPAGAGEGNSTVVGSGPDFVNAAVTPNPMASAQVEVSAGTLGHGGMQVALDVTGIEAPAGTRLGAHVHVGQCGTSATASGGHYQYPDGGQPLEQREVWLDFAVNAEGQGHAVATRNWSVSNLAGRSVVVHAVPTDFETGGAGSRLACTDLD
jgi:Cu/Zn superoxide dismutase